MPGQTSQQFPLRCASRCALFLNRAASQITFRLKTGRQFYTDHQPYNAVALRFLNEVSIV